MKKDEEYECYLCHEIFLKGLSDHEAEKEHKKDFPNIPVTECEVVCDDCYHSKVAPLIRAMNGPLH